MPYYSNVSINDLTLISNYICMEFVIEMTVAGTQTSLVKTSSFRTRFSYVLHLSTQVDISVSNSDWSHIMFISSCGPNVVTVGSTDFFFSWKLEWREAYNYKRNVEISCWRTHICMCSAYVFMSLAQHYTSMYRHLFFFFLLSHRVSKLNLKQKFIGRT